MNNKSKTHSELAAIRAEAKSAGKRVGFTNGCFDVLHLGHIKYLNAAKADCDVLIIGVNSDDSVKRLKGRERPLNPQEARLEILASVEYVDFVTLFEEDTPEELIKKLSPDVIFKGGDWKEDEIAGAEHVKSYGGEVKIMPYLEGYSTTAIIDKLRNSG